MYTDKNLTKSNLEKKFPQKFPPIVPAENLCSIFLDTYFYRRWAKMEFTKSFNTFYSISLSLLGGISICFFNKEFW